MDAASCDECDEDFSISQSSSSEIDEDGKKFVFNVPNMTSPEKRTTSPPIRVQSVKEYEDELNKYMRENFNLKLRIYFLEENRAKIASGPHDYEEAFKKNTELYKENLELQQELTKKHELLQQALQAMQLLEQENKKLVVKESEIEQFKNKIAELEQQSNCKINANDLQCTTETLFSNSINQQYDDNDANKDFQLLKSEITDLQWEVQNLQEKLLNQQVLLNDHEQKIEEAVQIRTHQIECELENKDKLIQQLEFELRKKIDEFTNMNEHNNLYQNRIENLQLALNNKEVELQNLRTILTEKSNNLDEQIKRRNEYRKNVDYQVKQIDYLKASLLSREKSVAEYEERLGKALGHSRTVESKYEKLQQELKHANDEISFLKQQLNRTLDSDNPITKQHNGEEKDDSSYTATVNEIDFKLQHLEDIVKKREENIKLLENQIVIRDEKINKLEVEQTRALGVIREFVKRENDRKHNKASTALTGTVSDELAQRDKEISNLKRELRIFKEMFAYRSENQNNPSSAGESSEGRACDYERMLNAEEIVLCEQCESHVIIKQYLEKIADMDNKIKGLVDVLSLNEQKYREYEIANKSNQTVLDEKNDKINELEQEINQLKIILSINKNEDNQNVWINQQIELRDKKIEQLEDELRKRRGNLQELVNKELWDKNREIERLQKLQISNDKENMQKINDESQEKSFGEHFGSNDEEKLKNLEEENFNLKDQLSELQENLKNCLKSKQQAVDMSSILINRLEELALFLNSLLKNKKVLGFLGVEKESALKSVVNESLNLSRSLSLSMSMTDDASFFQINSTFDNSTRLSLVNDFKFLNIKDASFVSSSLIPTHDNDPLQLTESNNLPDCSGRSVQSDILPILKSKLEKCSVTPKRFSLVEINEERSQEKIKRKSHEDMDPSESEAWSEPDRSVSLARIGLVDETLKSLSPGNGSISHTRSRCLSESSSDEFETKNYTPQKRSSEEKMSNARRNLMFDNSQNLKEEVNRLQLLLKKQEQENLLIQRDILEKDNQLRKNNIEVAEQIENLQKQKIEIEKQITEAENKVRFAEEQKLNIESQVEELSQMVKEVIDQKNSISYELKKLTANSKETIANLEKERNSAINEAQEARKRVESTFLDIKLSEMRLQSLQKSYDGLKSKFEQDLIENNLKWTKKLEDKEKEIELHYKNQYISKDEYNNKVLELGNALKEIDTLKALLEEMEIKLKTFVENERRLNEKIEELESNKNSLSSNYQKELDEVSQIASKAADERAEVVKYLEEQVKQLQFSNTELKNQLMQQKDEFTKKENEFMKKLFTTENEFKQQLDEKMCEIERLQKDGVNAKLLEENVLSTQISSLEKQKNQLELRISQLENVNADLENRLAKMNHRPIESASEPFLCATSPTSATSLSSGNEFNCKFNQAKYYSGYISDVAINSSEITNPKNIRWCTTSSNDEEQVRLTTNSSPDLGIESDQGRFSSLEVHQNCIKMRPFLPPLEITQNMNSMLSNIDLNESEIKNGQETEIQKLRNENIILKARLTKSQQTLEDTAKQLKKSNERKLLVERAVCNQIHKTSLVIRKAKANLIDSGSENENKK